MDDCQDSLSGARRRGGALCGGGRMGLLNFKCGGGNVSRRRVLLLFVASHFALAVRPVY